MLFIKSLDHEKHKKNRKTLPKKVEIVEDTTILSAQEVVAKSPEKRDGLWKEIPQVSLKSLQGETC